MPFCHVELRAAKPKHERYPNEINTLGDHLRRRRLDQNLLQNQVAEQIGVDVTTVCNWEGNASTPAIRYVPAILEFLGYDPCPPGYTLAERLATVRKVQGLSQRKLAEKLGVDPGTLQSWEAGRHQPTGKSLDIIGRILQSRGG